MRTAGTVSALAVGLLLGSASAVAATRPLAKKVSSRKSSTRKPAPKKPASKSAHARTAVKRRASVAAQASPLQRSAAMQRVESLLAESSDAPIEQAGALVPFFERLFQLETKATTVPVHTLHFGDSHTAADEWTGRLRVLLQQKFGDGGSGFSVAGTPFKGYRRFDARGGATSGWGSEGLRTGAGDGYFGLGGISISASRPGQSVFLNTACDRRLEIHYVQQPGGGSVAFYDNDEPVGSFTTDGEMAPGVALFETAPGPHRFMLKTVDARPVRLLGWVVDNPAGVTYEALGINGAKASLMLRWNPEMLAAYVQRRDPGMIVLAYGTNEASDPAWSSPGAYAAMFSSLLQRLRQFAPAATILIVGPGDRWTRTRAGWHVVPGIDAIIEAQRAACRLQGCAFWDTRKRTGGSGVMRDWFYAGLAQADRVHFTSAGYQRLGDVLYADLIRQYDVFRKSRLNSEQDPHGQAEPHR